MREIGTKTAVRRGARDRVAVDAGCGLKDAAAGGDRLVDRRGPLLLGDPVIDPADQQEYFDRNDETVIIRWIRADCFPE